MNNHPDIRPLRLDTYDDLHPESDTLSLLYVEEGKCKLEQHLVR